MAPESWSFSIDRGGTFTDVIGEGPDGARVVLKLLSENPQAYADAAAEGVRRILQRAGPKARAARVRMGTTVATNALLERKGEPTVLAVTQGFGDALRIGHQARPRLFDRRILLPEPLYDRVVEIEERLAADGRIIRPLNQDAARAALQSAFDAGFRSLAIVLMHSYRFGAHEAAVARIAREIGFTQISRSGEVSPLIKFIPRGDTAVVDAYLSPVLDAYVRRVEAEIGEKTPLFFMQSSGGLVSARKFRGKDAVLSGPAGGVVGMAEVGREAGFEHLIGFDMGGTSTDVAHYAGAFERSFDTEVAGVRLRAPMMSLHTVAAGGGSICRFDGARLRVGPESAGADPGPCAYRRGGPLTVTDCNLLLGKLQPDLFPAVFGPAGDQTLDLAAVRTRFAALAAEVGQATGEATTPEALAEGFLAIAVANMARAIKKISIERGHDLGAYTLVSFGGAGGQHAALVADALDMQRVLIHPLAGVLSAYGIGLCDVAAVREKAVEELLSDALVAELEKAAAILFEAAYADLDPVAIEGARVRAAISLQVRYQGSDTALSLELDDADAIKAAFEAAHLRQFGFIDEKRALIVEALVVEARARQDRPGTPAPVADAPPAQPLFHRPVRMRGLESAVPVYRRQDLSRADTIAGPALILEETGANSIEPGWTARIDAHANLLLERQTRSASDQGDGRLDPVRLELYNNQFMALAEQMGQTLQNTAHSVNIKERLDFSCALFDADANLIANAPHMPVHLGSMGDSVRAVVEPRRQDGRGLKPGDAYVLNAPYNGGTHLPDITVVMPVFASGAANPCAFVAARGHHGDIGGITPGSMPPMSRTLDEEGVLIDNHLLVEDGRFLEEAMRELLASGPWPARNPDQNIADLKAQAAACAAGARALLELIDKRGAVEVFAYMDHVKANAAEAVRRVIDGLKDGAFSLAMDDGATIRVAITIDHQARTAHIDFAGTSAQRPNNFNAPWSVCRAATLYVFRTLIDDDIPLNDGCMLPLTLTAEKGSMLNPVAPAAVVAGNVETSQAITDALYGALGALAASQGTMNNFTFGDETRQYYETICGGAGAGPGFDGASAVQTHMTNSRLTDPEVLELRYPVRLERFEIRKGSGGKGRWTGGDGVVREVVFEAPMAAAILSNRRLTRPFGLEGGEAALPGRTEVIRKDERVEELAFAEATRVEPGDRIRILTPGGGGYGKAPS